MVPGQLKVLFPFFQDDRPPQWLLLAGPADHIEAQTARRRWPGIKIVGAEPNPAAFNWQKEHGWPDDAVLIPCAVSYQIGQLTLRCVADDPHNASLEDQMHGPEITDLKVSAVTWDYLDGQHGPFDEAILWLDIEGWELEALCGAARLFQRNAVRLVNVELQTRREGKNREVERLLRRHGFEAVKDWNNSESCLDRIFIRKD